MNARIRIQTLMAAAALALTSATGAAFAQTFPAKILTEAGPVTVFDPGFPVHWHVET